MANNVNTLVSSYNGIKSGSYVGGQTEEEKSFSQLNKAASIASGASRDANPKKISESTLNNTVSYLSGARKTVYASDKEEDDTSLVSPNEDIYNRFMETVGPYVNMSESEKQYYYNMSGMIMKNGQSADEWAEDFLSKNAIANVLGVSRSTVEQYLPQMMEDYLGVENEKYLSFTTGATLINSIKQGVRQQEQANLQGDLINLYKSGYNDNSPEVQTLARAILQKDREMSYYQDSTPRLWTTEWAKSALQQLPYMAGGTLAGIAGNIVGGVAGSIIPGVGTTLGAQIGGSTARFLTYQKQFEASAFWNMKQAGVSTKTALKYADMDGLINGLNETFLDVGYGQIMGATGKVLGINDLGGKLIPSVAGKLAKNGSFGTFMGKFFLWMGLDASGEFVQESTQSLTSAALQAMAEYEDGIRMPYTDKEKVSDAFSQAWDEGVQGFLTGLFFGGQTSAVGILADVKTSADLKNTAIKTLSKESYVNNKENRQAVQNLRLGGAELSEEQIDKLLSGLYDSSQSARNELKNNVRKDIFEQLKNIDGTLEESSILNRVMISDKDIRNESGEIISGKNTEVKTRDDGSLYFVIDKNDTATPEEGKNTTSYTMRIANSSVVGTSSLGEVYVDAKVAGYENEAIDSVKSSPKALAMEQAGRINFTLNEDNKSLTIDSVSVQGDSKSLKTKAVQELISMYPEYTVEWENRTESDNAVYSDIESANPRNTSKETFGLNYNEAFSSDDADTAYVKRWLGTNFSEDSSENNFMATILKAAAKARGMDGQSFIEKYFTEIQESQEDDANTKGYMSTKRDEVTKQVKATIYAGKNADATTFLHELHHAIMLMGDNMNEFTQIYNKVKGTKQFRAFLEENVDLLKERIARKDSDGKFITDKKGRYSIDETKLNSLYKNSEKWTEDDFEFETRLYEAYIRNGQTFNPSLTGFFRRMAETFRQIYRALRNGFFKAKLNDEVIEYFDKLYGYDASTEATSSLSGNGDMQFLDDAIEKNGDTANATLKSEDITEPSIEEVQARLEKLSPIDAMAVEDVDESFKRTRDKTAEVIRKRRDWAKSVTPVGIVDSPIGKVLISNNSIDDSVAPSHGANKYTASLYSSLDKLITNSVYATTTIRKGEERAILISKFKRPSGEIGYVGIVVRKSRNNNLYYFHSVIKNEGGPGVATNSSGPVTAPSINNLLSKYTLVKNLVPTILKQDDISSLSAEEQYEAVKNQYYGTDKYMIAPNGRASNLTERQWIQTRTPSFLNWGGDWINDSESASVILDENGEPKRFYHGSISSFDTFREGENGIYFTDNKEAAWSYGTHSGLYEVFLKADETFEMDFEGESDTEETESRYALETEARYAKENGYDSVIAYNTFDGENNLDQYIVFSSSQIKSATDNNGDFSLESDSILRQDGGYNYQKHMSNRAVSAYAGGEMPMSKWTKAALNEAIEISSTSREVSNILTALPLEAKRALLNYSSWHHTGIFYNATDFYEMVDLSDVTPERAQKYADAYKQYKGAERAWNKAKKEAERNLKPNQKLIETTYNGTRLRIDTYENVLEGVDIPADIKNFAKQDLSYSLKGNAYIRGTKPSSSTVENGLLRLELKDGGKVIALTQYNATTESYGILSLVELTKPLSSIKELHDYLNGTYTGSVVSKEYSENAKPHFSGVYDILLDNSLEDDSILKQENAREAIDPFKNREQNEKSIDNFIDELSVHNTNKRYSATDFYKPYSLCPIVLQELGYKDLPLWIRKSKVSKILSTHNDIDIDTVGLAIMAVSDPLAVFDSIDEQGKIRQNQLVVVTEVENEEGKKVVVPLHMHEKASNIEVDIIASVYSKDSTSVFDKWASAGALRYLKNKEVGSQLMPLQLWGKENQPQLQNVLYREDIVKKYSYSNDRLYQSVTDEDVVANETLLKQIAEERSAILQVPTESDFLFQYAYHGAGADFNKFSLDFIGSGEGSQVFGYGLYFTESDVIARKYAAIGYNSSRAFRESQTESYKEQYEKAKAEIEKAGKQRAEERERQDELKAEQRKKVEEEYEENVRNGSPYSKTMYEKRRDEKLEKLESETFYTIKDWEFNILKRQYAEARNGYLKALALPVKDKHLYKVIIPDNGYLSWYDEVPKSLIKRIAEYRASEGYLFWTLEEEIERLSTAKTGGDLYALLAGTEPGDHGARFIDDYSASQILSRVGVVGIKYPAGSILGLPDDVSPDTYNYVIFDPKDIEIADHQFLKQKAIANLEEEDAFLSALRNDLESVSDSSVTLKQIGDDEWTEAAKRIALEAGSLEDFFKLYRDRIDRGDIELSDSNASLLLADIYEESRSSEYIDYDEYYGEDYEEFLGEENETETDVSDDWVVEEVEDNDSTLVSALSGMPDEVPDWFTNEDEDIQSASDIAKTTEEAIQAVEEAMTEVQKVVNDSDLPKGLSLEKSRSLDTSVQARAVEFASILKGSKAETIKFLEALRDANDEFFYESSYAEEAGQSGAREAVDEESYMQKETRRTAYDDFSNVSKFIQNLIFNSRGAQYAQRLNNLSDRAWKIVAGQVSANPELYMDLYARASNNTEWAGDNSIEAKVLSELSLTKEEWNKASYYKRRMYAQDVADKELRAKIMSGKFVDTKLIEEQHLQGEDYLFLVFYDKKESWISSATANKKLRSVCEKYNIATKEVPQYSLRHTHATYLRGSMDEQALALGMGHSGGKVRDDYEHRSASILIAQFEKHRDDMFKSEDPTEDIKLLDKNVN